MPTTYLGAPGTRAHTPESMERGIRKFYLLGAKVHDKGYLEEIFNVVSSEKKTESDVILAELGQAVAKAEGDTPAYDAMQEVYKKQVTHTTWCLAGELTEEAIEDNLYHDMMSRLGTALGKSMAYTRTVQAFSFFNDLTETIYTYAGTTYQLLEYQGHPILSGGNWSNRPQNATSLSQAALEERIQAWMVDMLDHRGLKMDRSAPAVLMVGPSDAMLADRLLHSVHRPQSADNDINPLHGRGIRVFVNPHLTDDGRWFLIGPKSDTMLVHFDRIRYQLARYGHSDTGNLRVRARARFSKHMPAAYSVMGSPGS